jgi:hypothetical protein
MAEIKTDILAFKKMQAELEAKHMGKWVLFHNETFIGVFESFEATAADAVSRFGRGPYLIRKIGEAPQTLPASVMFIPEYA